MKKTTEKTATTATKTTAEMIAELNAIRTTATAGEVNTQIAAINESLKADSVQSRDNRIAELLAMDKNALFIEFINHPCYTVFKLANDKESGDFIIAERDRQIGFKQLDDAFAKKNPEQKTLAKSVRYYGMVAHFVHNIARNVAGELSDEAKKVTVPNFNGEKEVEFDFSGCSVTALEKQLNAIVATILPDEIAPKMLKADVKAIRQGCVQNRMLQFTMQNEGRIMNYIFNAIEIRINEKAYTLNSRANCHKAKKEKGEKESA